MLVEFSSQAFNIIWQIFKAWWWLLVPFILQKPFLYLYKFWRIMGWLAKRKFIVLEVKTPREFLKPIKAMEAVLAGIHGVAYQPPDWWEEWIEGQVQLSVHFEIASIGGETHFYIRFDSPYRDGIEASIYSQYPEAEIREVQDYAKQVPQNIPNNEIESWGSDYTMLKNDHYPIKTHREFETGHEAEKEEVVDPVATLLEAMGKVKPGEQFWIQISAEPVSEGPLMAWLKKGEEIRDKLARRQEKPKDQSIIQEAAKILITGEPTVIKEEREVLPPEMKLTPGERVIILALEEKMSKPIFSTNIRFVFFGQKDIFFRANFRLAFAYFNAYMTLNCNGLVPMGSTFPKIHKSWFLPQNRLIPQRRYLRLRRLFRNYVNRFSPFFPRTGGTFKLNTEELASLYHFPNEATAPAPGAPRTEAKKGEGPLTLPT